MATRGPKSPRYNRPLTQSRIQAAGQAHIGDQEIIRWLDISESKFRKGKAGQRGFSPEDLVKLNSLIEVRVLTAPSEVQGELNFDSQVPIDTTGSPFEMRFLKKRNEQVWMVEIKPKTQAEPYGVAIPIGDGTTFIVDPSPKN